MKTASGLVFLTILGLLGIIIALAFAMLVSARAAYAGQRTLQAPALARLAAQEGVDHAIGVIRRQFDNRRTIPTQMTDAWRTYFWPIDAMKVRYDMDPWNQRAPLGEAGAPEDVNENDVRWESRLVDPYLDRHPRGSGYWYRHSAAMQGYFLHSGNARWYEPGVLTSDPVTRPLSFQLPHPCPPLASSVDPARRAGENWAPDIDRPLWYDASFAATEDLARRRYRLRYAVAVEDLGGHLLVTAPGPYDPSARSAAATPPTTPTDTDQARAAEIDPALAGRYAGALNNIARHAHPSIVGNYGELFDLAFRGLGTPMVSPPGSNTGTGLTGGRPRTLLGALGPAGDLQRWQDYLNLSDAGEPDRRPNARKSSSGTFDYFALGPVPSFHRLHLQQMTSSGNNCWLQLLFTPFGRVPEATATPTTWYQSYVDNPWRLNLPTAAPRALYQMVTAYMPAEYLIRDYNRKQTFNWTGWSWDDLAVPDVTVGGPWSLPIAHVALFASMATEANFADRGGISPGAPYPGADLAVLAGWTADLGKDVRTNILLTKTPGISLVGSESAYAAPIYARLEDTVLKEVQVVGEPGGSKIVLVDSVAHNEDSYWQDLHVAMLHALALAQWSWTDKVTGETSKTPGSGVPRWPSGAAATVIPLGYFPAVDAPGFAPGNPARDRDVDGDLIMDVPSTFDTVREVDAQFLRNLGESPLEYSANARPTAAVNGIKMKVGDYWNPARPELQDYAGSLTIKAIAQTGKATEAALMELVVNDMRMSFFGASPSYPDFRPLDLDDDGTVRCSCYPGGSVPTATVAAAAMRRFSLTGYIDFEKSRFYRIFVRGEVFDEVRGVAIAQDNLETVYVVDPDGDVVDRNFTYSTAAARAAGTGMSDSHVLFQRWLRNRYQGLRSAVDQ